MQKFCGFESRLLENRATYPVNVESACLFAWLCHLENCLNYWRQMALVRQHLC